MLDELNQCVFVLQTGPNIPLHLWISMNNWLYTFQRKNDKDRAKDERERTREGARD